MNSEAAFDYIRDGKVNEFMSWLGQNPSAVNSVNAKGHSLLHVAVSFGQYSMVEKLCLCGGLINKNSEDEAKLTPLHLAIEISDENLANRLAHFLISQGAELNAKKSDGQTVLHLAVRRSSKILVKSLVLAGADPFLKDDSGMNAGELNESTEIKDLLKQAFSLPLEF